MNKFISLLKAFFIFLIFFIVFLIGWLILYDSFCSFTLEYIQHLTGDRISFFGEQPLFGDPIFGLLILAFPLANNVLTKYFKLKRIIDSLKLYIIEFVSVALIYSSTCYIYGQYLLKIFRNEEATIYNSKHIYIDLFNVKMYIIYFLTISIGVFLTALICELFYGKKRT